MLHLRLPYWTALKRVQLDDVERRRTASMSLNPKAGITVVLNGSYSTVFITRTPAAVSKQVEVESLVK